MAERSPHYFRKKGATAEDIIHALSEKTFFADWCYPNQLKPDGNELCDLLVVFDDTAIIWQIKDLKTDEHGFYKESEVQKNVRQISGARRTLFELNRPIILKNPHRPDEVFGPLRIKNIHLISVLMGDATGPLHLTDTIKNYSVHVFTREFSDIALRELDTISDFCAYLRRKEEALKGKEVQLMGGEENLLGKYIQTGRNFDWMAGYDFVHVDEDVWKSIDSNPAMIEKRRLDEISYGWDSMIARAHDGTSPRYELIAREMARADRFHRRILSKYFMEAFIEVAESDHDMIRRFFAVDDTTYCFLIVRSEDYPRPARQNILQHMCFIARGLPPQNTRVIGVATSVENVNYDFAYLNMPEWLPEHETRKKELQEKFGIFVSPRLAYTPEDEYPST
jgi:hypothetical protein